MNVSLQPEPRSCLLRPIYSAISECSLSLIIPSCLNQLSHTSPPRPTYRATMWSSKLWGAGDLYFSRVNYSGPTLGLRRCGQVALRAGGDLLYLYSLLHYPSLKLDSHLLQTRMILTQRLYDTRSLHTTLGPLPGLCQPGTTGGGQCSALIAYFYWAPIT